MAAPQVRTTRARKIKDWASETSRNVGPAVEAVNDRHVPRSHKINGSVDEVEEATAVR